MKWTYPLVPIGEIVDTIRKYEPSQSKGIKSFIYIDISSVNRETKRVEEASEILSCEAPSRARQIVKTGDVLVSTVRPNLNAVAHLDSCFNNAVASTGFTVLRPKIDKLNARYLYYWVRTSYFVEDMVKKSTGASYPAVSDSIVKKHTIPLPPLEEQGRIAAILDRADAIRRKRQEAIALTEELLRSSFLEMFGDPATNSKALPTKPLGKIAQLLGGGTPSRKQPKYFSGHICWATSKDMGVDLLVDTEEHITEEAIENSATKLVDPGCLLVVVKSKILARRLPIARTLVPTCFSQDIKAIIPEKEWMVRYLHRHLQLGQNTLLQQARGVNTEGLTLEHLRSYPVMIPNELDMKRFIDIDIAIENKIKTQKLFAKISENCLSSIFQKAFRGEL